MKQLYFTHILRENPYTALDKNLESAWHHIDTLFGNMLMTRIEFYKRLKGLKTLILIFNRSCDEMRRLNLDYPRHIELKISIRKFPEEKDYFSYVIKKKNDPTASRIYIHVYKIVNLTTLKILEPK